MKKQELLVEDLTVGADPELFLWSEEKNKCVPVCGLVGGTKDEPLPITDKGHALQEDGTAIEYCIPPSRTCEEFIENNEFVKSYINETVLSPLNLVAKCIASTNFELSELPNGEPMTLGCSPDYNAWTGQENVINREDDTLSVAGGHIHIGYKNPNSDTSRKIIQAMDLFLGLQSVLLDPDTRRRSLYGKAGAFRLKSRYGCEYRALSNFWVESPELIKWAWNQTMLAIDFVNNHGIITNPEDIQQAINTSNVEMARMILDEYNIEVLEIIK